MKRHAQLKAVFFVIRCGFSEGKIIKNKWFSLKLGQNKKGQKISSCTVFWFFFTPGTWANGAARTFFGLSYFVEALVHKSVHLKSTWTQLEN